jgi:hypothetical protein
MWFGILLTFFLAYIFARILVNIEADEIIKNWKEYRCNPHVMLFAGMFKNKDDPRSDNAFAADNFEFCSSEIAKAALKVALKPVMDIFYQMSNAAIQSIGVTMNLRTLGANLYNGLNRMFDIFARRFNMTFHELHMSFLKQYSAIQKANGAATAAVYQGISVIRGIMNFFNLMIIVCIAILVILVIMTIFLFFLLAPAIPLIIITIAVVAAAGGAVGGMADSFCFSPETEVLTKDGVSRIDSIKNGTILKNGAEVVSILKFKTDAQSKFWLVNGILVSGSHIIYAEGKPIFVKDYADATLFTGKLPEYVYCINSTNNTIPIKGLTHELVFSDWEELDDDSMEGWDNIVRDILNDSFSTKANANKTCIDGESGFAPESIVVTPGGYKRLMDVKIGDTVYDGTEWTEVIGLVNLTNDEVHGKVRKLHCNGASWIKEGHKWIRAAESADWIISTKPPVSSPMSLFTYSGKIVINNEFVCDFSDVGLNNIHKTYDYTLSRLLQKCS